jgi:HK97 family phage major capsid protein
MANEPEAKKIETPENEVKIEITEEFAARLDESVAKQFEKYKAEMKKFSFHGGEKNKSKVEEAEDRLKSMEFIKAVATGDNQAAKAVHIERAKALNITGNETGGYLVPQIFETDILASFDGYSEIIRDCDVKSFNKPGNIFNLNELDTRVSVFFVDENGAGITSTTPSFTAPQIAIFDMLGSTDLTQDFLEDQENDDIMGNLSKQYGEVMAQKMEERLINGDFTQSGVVTKGLFKVTGTNDVAILATASGYSGIIHKDLVAAYFSAISIAHYQDSNQNGKYYMHGLALEDVYNNLFDNSAGNFFTNPYETALMKINGRPVSITNQAPTPATTVSNPFVLYGNLNKHVKIRRKRGITMKINDQGTTAAGRNLNYQLGRELVVSQRIGFQIVEKSGLTRLVT